MAQSPIPALGRPCSDAGRTRLRGTEPEWVERTAEAIRGNGTPVETMQITGPNGYLNGVLHIGQAGPRIAAFLAR